MSQCREKHELDAHVSCFTNDRPKLKQVDIFSGRRDWKTASTLVLLRRSSLSCIFWCATNSSQPISSYLRTNKAKIADVVQIHPSDFSKSSIRAIEDFVNLKYANKVIHKVGLCVGFHSLISASEGLIGHGTGIVNVNVDFRIIIWRPWRGEILCAKIMDFDMRGIYLSMHFFKDIIVPSEALFEGTTWEEDPQNPSNSNIFVWRTENSGDEPPEFYFDRAEKVQFRVESEEWNDLSPQKKRPQDFDEDAVDDFGFKTGPYRIIGSAMLTGLGPAVWWLGEEDLAAEAEGDDTNELANGDTEMS